MTSREVPADVLEAWTSWLGFARRYHRVPGVQAAVWVDGEVVLSVAHGVADESTGEPLREDHMFRVASHSKTFTATVVLQLVEDGRLRLDDSLGTLLGASGPAADVTVRDLLTHTSGLSRDGREADHWLLAGPFPDRDAVRSVLDDPGLLVLERRERFKYSNLGYGVLGLVVEQATGGTWEEAVHRGVVDRLGLTGTLAGPSPDEKDGLVTGHSALSIADSRVPIDDTDAGALGAATGVCSTARDLVRYLGAHVGGDELLPAAARREMQNGSQTTGGDSRYGLGMADTTAGGRRVVGHNGGWPGQITTTLADPDARIAVSVLTNAIDGPSDLLARRLFTLLDLAEGADPDPTDEDLGRFAGRFASVWGALDIVPLGGRLHQLDPTADDPAARAFTLSVVDGTTLRVQDGSGFGAVGESLRYTFAADGTVEQVRGGNGTTMRPLGSFTLGDRVRLGDRP